MQTIATFKSLKDLKGIRHMFANDPKLRPRDLLHSDIIAMQELARRTS